MVPDRQCHSHPLPDISLLPVPFLTEYSHILGKRISQKITLLYSIPQPAGQIQYWSERLNLRHFSVKLAGIARLHRQAFYAPDHHPSIHQPPVQLVVGGSRQKGIYYCSPKRTVSQALLLVRYKAVLPESSFHDSSACSLTYFFIASSVILPIVDT